MKAGSPVDSIGDVGLDPGSEWGAGLISTQNNTIRRLPSVCQGDTVVDDDFDPSTEWEGFAQDTFDGLGSHTASCSSGPADPLINEFVFNHTGSDLFEFIEVLGDPDTGYSAFTLLEIEGDSTSNMGAVDDDISVGTTSFVGYWTTGGSNLIENGTVTLLLVEDFAVPQSVEGGLDLDDDNDGIIDNIFWSRIVDCVAVFDGGGGDQTYCETVLDNSTPPSGTFAPGGASRIPNGTDTDTSTDWVRNDFDGAGIPPLDPGTPDIGEALNTPDSTNELVGENPLPQIVINEILNNGGVIEGDETQWFELYNAGDSDVDIDGWTIADDDGDNHQIDNGGPLMIPAGGYLVLGSSFIFTAGLDFIDYTYEDFFLSTGVDEIILYDGPVFQDGPVPQGEEIDRVEYDNGLTFPDPQGASMALISPDLDNNVGENWCVSSTEIPPVW